MYTPIARQEMKLFIFCCLYMTTTFATHLKEGPPSSTSISSLRTRKALSEVMAKNMKPKEKERKSLSNGSLLKEKKVTYKECRKNHAASMGLYAVDGCCEFMAAGEEGTSSALRCAACSCHRNFHRREVESHHFCDCSSISTTTPK